GIIIEESLAPYVGDRWMCLPIIIGGFIGALGFPAVLAVTQHWRRPGSWSLHAKLTVVTSAALFVVGAVAIAALEWGSPASYRSQSTNERILASLLAGMTPLASGFSTVDVSSVSEGAWLVQDALMFVGGVSASTAGGVKGTAVAVMLPATRAVA